METLGNIEIRITGKKGNLELQPQIYDIKEIQSVIEQAEKLLFPNEKKRPLISYKIEEGSVRHIFKTSIQAIIGFNAVLGQVNNQNNIDFLELNSSKAVEAFQTMAINKDYSFEIFTSIKDSNKLIINSKTSLYRTQDLWIDAEFYFYGKITDAGGKEKANIHLSTEDYGTLFITTPKEFLEASEKNILYKTYGVRAKGKQNSKSGEIDNSSLTFLDLIDYNSKYDESYLNSLRNKAKNWLTKISANDRLKEIRGADA